MLKRNLLAYALACALTSTLTAVAGATAASAAPSAPATPSPAVDASIASDPACAAQIAKLRKAKAGTVAVCMSTASGRSTPTLTKKQVLSRASAASPGMSPGNVSAQVQVAEMPDWCFEREHQHNGWWFERNEACETRDGLAEFIFLDIDTPVVLGTIEYQEYNFAFSVIAATWVQQVSIVPTSITEAAVGASVEGLDASCDGSCDPSGTMDFPPQLVSETGVHNGNGQFQSTAVGPGEIGSAISSISYAFTTPEFKEIVAPAVTTMPAIRCDNALPGSGPGCVFPQYIPPLQTGIENPEYSQHLGDALRSGLPGAYPDGTPLHRTTSALIRDLNGAKACPDRYPRPSGKSCDEYPFRSTYEGAAVAIPPGVARTFDWCEIDEPPGTGPVGYSVCMIDELQNSSGGGFLNSFYLSNRVLDHDPFRVWVQSGVLDAFIPPQGVTDRPPTADAGPDVSGDEGSPIALHGAAADAESTPTTHWTYVAHTDVDHGATCSFGDAGALSTTITCTDDGTFDVRLTATDDAGNSVTDTAVVHVSNVRPTLALTGPAAWQLYRAGTPVTVTAPVTDPGTNDTHTCVATWDDGSTSSYAASGHACNQSHTFAHAGMYTITLSATDDDGGVSDTVSVMVVVYDPDAGWTNMDGSTATPSGALAAYPNANQWTWAHLDAHYYTATGPPVGVAQTWVPGTPYGMNSVALQWLVVTPDGKIAARGTGTGNDGSALGFVFYGYRGCPATGPDCQAGADRMRLVVWSLAAGPNPGAGTVYDNRPAAGYDIDVTEPQPLTSGAVQIHH